jgi:hypothetical protein
MTENNFIEEMVDQVELRRVVPVRPIHVTVKRGICHVKCSFPHIREFYREIISDETYKMDGSSKALPSMM